jgi:hypothetical protein
MSRVHDLVGITGYVFRIALNTLNFSWKRGSEYLQDSIPVHVLSTVVMLSCVPLNQLEDVFSEISLEPVAAASLGQV